MGVLVRSGEHDASSSRYWEREARFHRERANELRREVSALRRCLEVQRPRASDYKVAVTPSMLGDSPWASLAALT